MSTEPPIQLPFSTSHAFIVGINDYQHLSPLSTAVNDARVLAERLADQHNFTVHTPLLNATHQSLRKLLTEDIPKLVGPDDRVLFYFAGHGIALDGEEGPNGYLVAADTRPGQENTLIPMQVLHDALTGLPCRHGLLILDCCFSGAFKWSSGFRDVIFDLPKVIYEERFWRYCKDPAWQVITSSAHDQKAVDILTNQSLGLREEGKSKHSPFAASLLKALAGDADIIPAGTGDGIITATELYAYLRNTVENATTENAKRQSPAIFNLKRHDKGEFIFLHPNHRFNLPPTPDRNPFMGLASYNEEDANLFYGRDRVVAALLEKVKANSFTVVSGASGTGKSSVIKAGVLPQLRKAGRTILPIIRPGKEPMQTIATELPDMEQQLKNGAPVLVIDQYEELITQCLNKEERVAFEKQIAQWLQQYPALDIILSVRSDFEPQFESEVLAPWWAKGRYVVPVFSLEEIREVITRPAAQAVLFYEPEDLVEQLSEEVSQAPGALPLLSFTLSELYHAYLKSGRVDRALAQEDYLKLGGVIGALRTRADAEYESLNPDEQSSMRKLMLRMVSLEGGELAGKRVYSEELQFNDTNETARLQTIARRLVDARLLLQGTDGQGRAYIEPAHDALVRAWGRLWEWVKTTGEENITLQYKLSQAVNDYKELAAKEPKKARNLLWTNNPRLDLLKAALSTKNHNLNAQEEIFVRDSIKRRTARQRTSWGIAIGVMAGLLILFLFANNQRQEAIRNEGIAKDQTKLAEAKTKEVQDSAKVAARQRLRANEEAAKAISNSLASRSILAEQTDPTAALRIAELALKYDSTNTNALGALLTAYYREDFPSTEYFYTMNTPLTPDNSSVENNREILATNAGELANLIRGFSKIPQEQNPSTISPDAKYLLMGMPPNIEGYNEYTISILGQGCPIDNIENHLYFNSYVLDHRGDRNKGMRFYPRAFSHNSRQVLVPNDNRVELLNVLKDCKLKFARALSGPASIRWAVFQGNDNRIIGQSLSGEYYSWNLDNKITTIADDSGNIFDKIIHRIYANPQGSEFIFIWAEYGASLDDTRIDITAERRDNKGNPIDPEGNRSWVFSQKDHIIKSNQGTIIDLNNYLEFFKTDEYTFPTESGEEKYKVTFEKSNNDIHVISLVSGKKLVLKGHLEKPYSVSFDPNRRFIVSSSLGEIKFWDWRGYNFYSTNFGGKTQILADGKTLCLWEEDREKEQTFPFHAVRLLDIDPVSILNKVNAEGIHQLNGMDRLKYGVGY
ncbi:caspase family protein [Lewinella sp. LCG006]|uniref:nSTAND1 domain-containing NTPase n=1 Tax=Lewinella sp. LCG006 TaxID=3231911 RepID=UPI00346044D2